MQGISSKAGLRAQVCAGMLMGLGLISPSVRAQAPEAPVDSVKRAPVQWALYVDGDQARWQPEAPYSIDSLQVAAKHALEWLQQDGHYLAEIDSAAVDEADHSAAVRIFARRGPTFHVGRVHLAGVEALDSLALLAQMDTRPGRVLEPLRLEADLEMVLSKYERAGYPLVQITVTNVDIRQGGENVVDLNLHVEEGRQLRLSRVEVTGGQRTKPGYVARVAGLRPGRQLVLYDPDAIRQRLEATGLFKDVGAPELMIDGGGDAVLRIPLEEAPPGNFDLVLGYLPATGPDASGSFVGNGHLLLRNLFGEGREMALRLNRLPGQVSSVDVRVADPFFLGLFLGVEGRFEGLQQDSTFGKQRYMAEVSYRLTGGLQAFLTFSQEATRPGQSGVRIQQATKMQRVPRANAWFAGLGVRFQQLDQVINPRSGFFIETNLEQGRKERSALLLTAAGDTTSERLRLRQERLQGTVRAFVPTFKRQVVVVGGAASVLLSNEYDQSDLFRFGGASTLRGYNEDQFLGRFVARGLMEYRYQLDRSSYAYLFFDMGYVDTPALPEVSAARSFHPGYGIGMQFGTKVGLVNASYALNPDDNPAGGKIHVGLSFGL